MALTGLQIQKLLPKTNCKECGSNTCLAFAMKLAAKKAELAQCPYASDEAKQVLGAASEPPVKTIALGPDSALKLGDESVLYRHEKTFVHRTALAVNVNDTDDQDDLDSALHNINGYVLERVGETIRIDLVGVRQKGFSVDKYVQIVRKAWETTRRPLILQSTHIEALAAAAKAVAGSRSILAAASEEMADALLPVAQEFGHVLSVTAADLNKLVALVSKIRQTGFNDLLLQFPAHSLAEQFQINSITRRAALKDQFKALGYPSLCILNDADVLENTVRAVNEICKYGGVCLLPDLNPAQLTTLATLRQNIYTDPQKPIQVEPKLYAIGEPAANAPVFVTTNFSLTYFIVSGEIENSGLQAWLLVPECEGMSVLTAWAAGKFSGSHIAKFAKSIELENLVSSRTMIIPGYVSQISGELEEQMHGWKVIVGPQEAADLESFIKARLN
jgi:acetyl-CoA decarbonylase/synthase, CODH/ACS complex subunit gamma